MSAIIEAIEKVVENKRPHNILVGTVIKTMPQYCQVKEDVTGKVFFKVRYNSLLANKEDRILVKPKENTEVAFVTLPTNKDAYIISTSEVENIIGAIGTTKFELDNTGYKIESNGENLKLVMNDFIAEVNKIVVVQGNTINVAAVSAIQKRLNKILK